MERRTVARPLIIFGAGGHGKVVLDAALCTGQTVAWMVDAHPNTAQMLGVPVISTVCKEWSTLASFEFLVAIGHNETRERVFRELQERGGQPVNVIHPRATVARSVRLGAGIVVCAGAVINPEAVIGDNCIINTSASVDHDCILGENVHLCPGVHLAGAVQVGEGTMIGTGAVVIPGVKIGRGCVVGAGAVVTRDLPDGVVAYGVPAVVRRAEDGGRKTEDGGLKTEDGGRKTEDGGRKTEDGRRRTEDGGQKTEDGRTEGRKDGRTEGRTAREDKPASRM